MILEEKIGIIKICGGIVLSFFNPYVGIIFFLSAIWFYHQGFKSLEKKNPKPTKTKDEQLIDLKANIGQPLIIDKSLSCPKCGANDLMHDSFAQATNFEGDFIKGYTCTFECKFSGFYNDTKKEWCK